MQRRQLGMRLRETLLLLHSLRCTAVRLDRGLQGIQLLLSLLGLSRVDFQSLLHLLSLRLQSPLRVLRLPLKAS